MSVHLFTDKNMSESYEIEDITDFVFKAGENDFGAVAEQGESKIHRNS